MSLQPKLKLTYFNGMGRAEAIRLALVAGGIDFEDERIDFAAWMAVKPTMPFKQLPVLHIGDSEVLSQSATILRYVGKLGGLYPSDPLLASRVDQVIDGVEGILSALDPTFSIKDLDAKIAARKTLVEEKVKPLLVCIEACLAKYGTAGFSVGAKLTTADVRLAAIAAQISGGSVDGVDVELFSDFKHISAVVESVNLNSAVAAWNRKNNMPKLKLVYFDIGGRAEAIRLALHSAGIEFEDERIGKEELMKRKPDLPFGQLPIMHIGEQVVGSQSGALLRYVGRLSQTYPLDPIAALKVDEVICGLEDAQTSLIGTFSLEGDAKIAAREELIKGKMLNQMQAVEVRVGKHSRAAGFCVGDSLTIADVTVYTFLTWGMMGVLDGIPASFFEQFTNLMAVVAKVKETKGCTEYLNRKK